MLFFRLVGGEGFESAVFGYNVKKEEWRLMLEVGAEVGPARYEPAPGTKEAAVLETLFDLEQPLFNALRREYPERGWMVCGPASLTVGYVLAERTGIPLGLLHRSIEHLEFSNSLYIPDDPDKPSLDHMHVRYFTGARDEVLVIDSVAQMLWEPEFSRAEINIEQFYTWHLNRKLRLTQRIFPFTVERAEQYGPHIWGVGADLSPQLHRDMMVALHDSSVFQDEIILSTGEKRDVSNYWGSRLRRVYEEVMAALA